MLSFVLRTGALALAVCGSLFAQVSGPDEAPELDYLFFKERVQPIFLAERPGQARCVSCHVDAEPRLEPVGADRAMWDNDASQRNFEAWTKLTKPGKPLESPVLVAPLASAGGGSDFHPGGKRWATTGDPEWQTLAAWVRGQKLGALALATAAGGPHLFQTNAAGENIHVINLTLNQVVGLIEGVEAPSGVAAAPDGARLYAGNAGRRTLDVVDAKTLAVFKRIPLDGRPGQVAVANDGSKVYVGLRDGEGAVQVIDAATLTPVKTIPIGFPADRLELAPNGEMLFVGSSAADHLQVIDAAVDELSFPLPVGAGLGPLEFQQGGDGSTRNLFVQLAGLHGFVVIDFGPRAETERVELPEPPGLQAAALEPGELPTQGLALTSDQEILWIASRKYGAVYAYGVPQRCRPGRTAPDERCEWELLSVVDVGDRPASLALSPDDAKLFVALAGENLTAVVDTATGEVIKRIPVGNAPGTNIVGVLNAR